MKIIQALGWYFPESSGGTEVYVNGLCQRLLSAKHKVLIAAPDPNHNSEREYEYEGVQVYRYPIPSKPTREECQGLLPVRGTECFHRWIQKERPNVVHFHTFVTGLGLPELKVAKALGARVVVTTHSSSLGYICQRGTMMRWGERLCDGVSHTVKCAACELQNRGFAKLPALVLGSIPPALARIGRFFPGSVGTAISMSDLIVRNHSMQREMLENVDKFVLLTRWAFQAAAANGSPIGKLALNPLGIDQRNFQRKPSPEKMPTKSPVTIGYLGRFERIKGVHELARAVSSLPHTLAFRMEFRGPVNSRAEQEVLNELKLIVADDPRVTFAPAVPSAEVTEILIGYDVVCCPSICLEGGPTVALEAHAVGTPVVGTRIGGLTEMIIDGVNGRLINPGDWKALATLVQEMAANPTGTIDKWRTALPPVRTMDDVTAEYLSLYDLPRHAA